MPENGAGTLQQIRARLERLASLEPALHDSDFLLTWQHSETSIRFVLEAAEVLEALFEAGLSSRVFENSRRARL